MLRCILILPLMIALVGCSKSHDVTGPLPTPVTASDLSGQTFNVLCKNADESVILLGHLRFDPIQGRSVSGTWDLYQWSGPAAIPGLPSSGGFTGTLEVSALILKLPLADPQSSLGIFSSGFVRGRLSGTMSLLPSRSFEGAFEAIRDVTG